MNSPDIQIVQATHDDIPELEEVRYAVWRSSYPQVAPDYISVADVDEIFSDERVAEAIARGKQAVDDSARHITVAKQGQKIVGLCISRINEDSSREVLSLYVLDEYQGQGIGGMLLSDAIEWFEGETNPIKLDVVETNHRAILFYEQFGFAFDRKIPPVVPEPPIKYIPHIEMIRKPASIG